MVVRRRFAGSHVVVRGGLIIVSWTGRDDLISPHTLPLSFRGILRRCALVSVVCWGCPLVKYCIQVGCLQNIDDKRLMGYLLVVGLNEEAARARPCSFFLSVS